MSIISNGLVQRVKDEVELMRCELGGAQIILGTVTVAGTHYVGVIVSGLRVDPHRFSGSKDVKLLILVPADYPRVPPLGVYLNQPHQLRGGADGGKHFVGRGVHGAASIEVRGWYWYCHALGAFDGAGVRQHWRPGTRAGDGHNLASVITAARVSLHEDR